MCLAVPGQLVEWVQQETPFAEAWIDFAGVRRRINMACLPESQVGDYVLVHAGIAISRIDAAEAERVQSLLGELLNPANEDSSTEPQSPPRE